MIHFLVYIDNTCRLVSRFVLPTQQRHITIAIPIYLIQGSYEDRDFDADKDDVEDSEELAHEEVTIFRYMHFK